MTINDYLKGLSKVVSSLVGNKLSTVKGEGNTTRPSVFIARRKPNKPEYPYAACDYVGSGDYGLRQLHSRFVGNDQETYYNRRLRLRVAFYGNYGDDILSITDDFRNRLLSDRGLQELASFMEGAGLISISEPNFNSNVLSTEYEEFSFITIDFWVISTVREEQFDDITSVDINGNLYQKDFQQVEPPLTINTVVNDQ